MNSKNKLGFVSFLILILTLAILCVIGYFMYKSYFNFPASSLKTEFPQSPGQQTNITNSVTVIENVKEKIRLINEEHLKQQEELEGVAK